MRRSRAACHPSRRPALAVALPLAAVLLAALTAASPLVPAALAGDIDGRLGVGVGGGFMKLVHGENDYSDVDQFGHFRLVRGLSRHVALELYLKYGWIRPGVADPGEEAGISLDTATDLYTVIWQPAAGVLYRFAPDSPFCPFVGFSVGGTAWRVRNLAGVSDIGLDPSDGPVVSGYDDDGQPATLSRTDFTAALTAGLDWFLTGSLALNFGARYHMMPNNEVDNVGLSSLLGPAAVDANTGMVETFAGLTVFFGAADRDGDGIRDADDACPDQPEDRDGFQDLDGCPDPDDDGDGVPDLQDQCRDQPEDRDGFEDLDGCPDPDNDGDGILDAADRCPDQAEDLDGFEDGDGCPDPDNDGDGVLDADDRCPDTPDGVEVDREGCPVVAEIEASLILEGVTFVSGSAELTAQAREILDGVAAQLRAYPEVTVEVQGHTDSVGSSALNRRLSQERADSVRSYLVDRGIAPDRIVAVGYGEDYPIASNDTEAGRAQNRRVELVRTDL